jgi:hypothetical protein
MVTSEESKQIIVPAADPTTDFDFTIQLSGLSQLRFEYVTSDGIVITIDPTNPVEATVTVTNADYSAGGNIELPGFYELTPNDIVCLYRNPAFTQEIDFVQHDIVSSKNRQKAMDKLVFLLQYVRDLVDGILVYPVAENLSTPLSVASERASKVGRWDSDGILVFTEATTDEDPDDRILGRISTLILQAGSSRSALRGLGLSLLWVYEITSSFSGLYTGLSFDSENVSITDSAGLFTATDQESANDEVYSQFMETVTAGEAFSAGDPVGYDGETFKKIGESSLVANELVYGEGTGNQEVGIQSIAWMDNTHFIVVWNDLTDYFCNIGKHDGSGGITWLIDGQNIGFASVNYPAVAVIASNRIAVFGQNASNEAYLKVFDWDGASTLTEKDDHMVYSAIHAWHRILKGPNDNQIWLFGVRSSTIYSYMLEYDAGTETISEIASGTSLTAGSGFEYLSKPLRVGNYAFLGAKQTGGTANLKYVSCHFNGTDTLTSGAHALVGYANSCCIDCELINDNLIMFYWVDSSTNEGFVKIMGIYPDENYDQTGVFVTDAIKIAPNYTLQDEDHVSRQSISYLGNNIFVLATGNKTDEVLLKYFWINFGNREKYGASRGFYFQEIFDDIVINSAEAETFVVQPNPDKGIIAFAHKDHSPPEDQSYIALRSLHKFYGIAKNAVSAGEDLMVQHFGILDGLSTPLFSHDLIEGLLYGYSYKNQDICLDFDEPIGVAISSSELELLGG